MSLADAELLTPQIRLSKLINNLAPSDFKADRIIVAAPEYMKALENILSNTSKDVLQTYFLWKVIQAFASVIEADAIKPYTRFSNQLQGKVSASITSIFSMLNRLGPGIIARAVEDLRKPCRQRTWMDLESLLC